MALEPTPTPDDLQKQIDALKKQKDLVDAQKALADSQKALADAQRASSAAAAHVADQVAAAQNIKDVADARKAQADAEAAAFKARIGDVPSSGVTGSVEAKDQTGALEAALLAARALGKAAKAIGASVWEAVGKKAGTKVVAMSISEAPTFQALVAYKMQERIVESALVGAIANSAPPKEGQGPREEAVPILGAAGTVLDATNKLLSFFRTDYTVSGVAVSLEDSVAVTQVANEVRASGCFVTLPTIFDPGPVKEPGTFFINDLTKLSLLKQEADRLAKAQDAEVTKLTREADDEKDAKKKVSLQQAAQEKKTHAEALRSATALFDGWLSKLNATDDKGGMALVAIAKEKAIADQLALANGGHLLLVKVQKAGGGYLIKKNFWTLFGGMPLYHMGGVAVSYTLLNGDSGAVEAAGLVPTYGGFVKAGELQSALLQ